MIFKFVSDRDTCSEIFFFVKLAFCAVPAVQAPFLAFPYPPSHFSKTSSACTMDSAGPSSSTPMPDVSADNMTSRD